MKEVLGDGFSGNRTQIEALATREDGRQDLVNLRGGENEFDVRRWFFERLEQGVEGLIGEHVDLVDVVNFELPAHRCVVYGFAQGADLIDAIIGSTVDLNDIKRSALGNLLTDGVIRIEVDLGTAGTIKSFGKNPRSGGLACATGADEKIGMSEPILRDRVFQGTHNVILTEDIVEGGGAVFSSEDLVTHERDCKACAGIDNLIYAQNADFFRGFGLHRHEARLLYLCEIFLSTYCPRVLPHNSMQKC